VIWLPAGLQEAATRSATSGARTVSGASYEGKPWHGSR
jgi:hypothetical protein